MNQHQESQKIVLRTSFSDFKGKTKGAKKVDEELQFRRVRALFCPPLEASRVGVSLETASLMRESRKNKN